MTDMMHRLSIPFVVLLLVASGGVFVRTAHAQTCPPGQQVFDENSGCQPIQTGDQSCAYGYTFVDENAGCVPTDTITNNSIDPATAKTQISLGQKDTTPGSGVWNSIMQKIMTLFAWLLGVAALTLNSVVYYTVLTMGNYIKDLTAVGVSWRILRDIGNIALIFGFLVSGVSIIMNYDIYGWGKKMIPKLLIAAVFLNFSLVVAEAVIDVGNLFATQFYTQINGGVPATEPGGFDLQRVNNEGISNKVMAQIGLQGLYASAINNPSVLQNDRPWYVGFLGIILFIVMAFVFFSLAFILIARFVVLIYLIITSPIGFAGLAIPKLEGLAKSWWHQLFEQTLTAPVLMLLLYIALAVITDASFITGFGASGNPDAWTGIINQGVADPKGFMGILISFLVAAGLLLAVTIAAKKLGAAGAGGAMKLAGAASFGAVAWGARSTAGLGLNFAARRFRTSRLARIPVFGRTVSGALDRGAKASFDIRGTKLLSNLPGGVDAGKAQVGGYRAIEEAAIKAREAHAKSLKQTEGKRFFGKQLWKGEKERTEDAEAQKVTAENTRDEALNSLSANHKNERKPLEEQMNRSRQAAERIKKNANARKDEIDRAQMALNNDVRQLEQVRARQKEETDELKTTHEKIIKPIQETIDKLKRKPAEDYANRIVWGPGQFMNRNVEAAKKIKEQAKKSKTDKDMDVIKKLLEEEEKKSEGGGEKKEEKKEEKPAAGAASTP